jgi:hypothetical protein
LQVKFTFDAGTSKATDPYLMATASFIEEIAEYNDKPRCWQTVSSVLACHKIEGAHTAETFAEMLQAILRNMGLCIRYVISYCTLSLLFLLIYLDHKISYMSVDNHLANNKALHILSDTMNECQQIDLGAEYEDWDPIVHCVR